MPRFSPFLSFGVLCDAPFSVPWRLATSVDVFVRFARRVASLQFISHLRATTSYQPYRRRGTRSVFFSRNYVRLDVAATWRSPGPRGSCSHACTTSRRKRIFRVSDSAALQVSSDVFCLFTSPPSEQRRRAIRGAVTARNLAGWPNSPDVSFFVVPLFLSFRLLSTVPPPVRASWSVSRGAPRLLNLFL